METSHISWTHGTFNLVWGCSEVSPACDNCYARTFSKSKGFDVWNKGGERRLLSDSYWREPLKWNRKAAEKGQRMRVFCGSMCDWAERHPVVASQRERLWPLIKATPNLDWLLLSKRFDNIEQCLPWKEGEEAWPNVWVGTTAEDQKWADTRLGYLKKKRFIERLRPKVFFISAEPLLGRIDFEPYIDEIDWMIVGGESGPHSRPMSPQWAEDIRALCAERGVPYHFKQHGEWLPVATPRYHELDGKNPYKHVIMTDEGVVREATPAEVMGLGVGITDRTEWEKHKTTWAFAKLGKERAGNLLFGREYLEVPTVGG